MTIDLLLDVDCGMGRTGLPPRSKLMELYRAIAAEPATIDDSVHVYDGHIQDSAPKLRRKRCEEAFSSALEIKSRLEAGRLSVPRLVAGGSPTFRLHAENPMVTDCSPSATILWDTGYQESFSDLPFRPAAYFFTRAISRLSEGKLCLDLGGKAVSADKPQPRVIFVALPDAEIVSHSEEHLILRNRFAKNHSPGDFFLSIPRHIGPAVALYDKTFIFLRSRRSN